MDWKPNNKVVVCSKCRANIPFFYSVGAKFRLLRGKPACLNCFRAYAKQHIYHNKMLLQCGLFKKYKLACKTGYSKQYRTLRYEGLEEDFGRFGINCSKLREQCKNLNKWYGRVSPRETCLKCKLKEVKKST